MSGPLPDAYSRLGLILARENVSVRSLQRKLEAAGVAVNVKSLYRLTEDSPLQKVDLRIAAAVCHTFGIALGELISFDQPEARLKRLDAKSQARLDSLMAKNNETSLTATERKEFLALAEQAHRDSMENARTLLTEKRRARNGATIRKKAALLKRRVVV